MAFIIRALSRKIFEHYFLLTDEELANRNAQWLTVDDYPGFPCRVSLSDAQIGERVLALSYTHQDNHSPYNASGPIFVREKAQQAQLEANEIPEFLLHRQLSLRVYDKRHFIFDSRVAPGNELYDSLQALFRQPDVAYIHIHNAGPGCFCCAVYRAD